jgi:transposase-like protein
MNEYSEKIKSTMVAKMTAPGGISASALSQEVGIPHQTLSRWRNDYATLGSKSGGMMKSKRPEDWTAEEKLKAVIEYAKLDEQEKGKYLREKGLHSVHLQRWEQQIIKGLDGRKSNKKDPRDKKIKALQRELDRKEKALAEAAALLVLKKKAQEIWGDREDEK